MNLIIAVEPDLLARLHAALAHAGSWGNGDHAPGVLVSCLLAVLWPDSHAIMDVVDTVEFLLIQP